MFAFLEKVHEPAPRTAELEQIGVPSGSGDFRDLCPNILDADRPRAPGGRQRGTRRD